MDWEVKTKPQIEGVSKRVPQLDGVRGLAIALVLIWHFYATMKGPPLLNAFQFFLKQILSLSWSGVDLFFVLSGFLIGGILIDQKGAKNYFQVFYFRRACRILPMYFLLLIAFMIFSNIFHDQNGAGLKWLFKDAFPILAYAAFVQNFFIAATGFAGPNTLAATWSLAIEEQFYIILPFLIRFLPLRLLPITCVSLIILAPVLRTFFILNPNINPWAAFVLLPSRMDALLLGVLGAWMVKKKPVLKFLQDNLSFIKILFVIFGVGYLLFSLGGFAILSLALTPMGYTWLSIFYLLLLLIGLLSQEKWIRTIYTFKPLRSLGTLSYSIYLFHLFFHGIFHHFLAHSYPSFLTAKGPLSTILALIATIIFATLTWFLLEKPVINYSRRMKYTTPQTQPLRRNAHGG